MSATEQRALPLLLRHPVLLASPMLGATAFSFIRLKIVSGFEDRYFPRIPPSLMRHGSHVALPVVLAGLRNSVLRLAIMSSTQIAQILVEAFAVALTTMLVTRLYQRGADTFGSAVQRLREIPALGRTLFWFTLRLYGIGLAAGLVVLGPFVLFVLSRGVHAVLPPHVALLWETAVFACVWIALSAYFAMPYFVDVVLYIQQQTLRDDSVRGQVATEARRYAWIAIGAALFLGLCSGYANLSLAGMAAMNHVVLGTVVKLAIDLITDVPKIVFVIAVAMLVTRTTALERESEVA